MTRKERLKQVVGILALPFLVWHIAYMHFDTTMPLYLQAIDWAELGFSLTGIVALIRNWKRQENIK